MLAVGVVMVMVVWIWRWGLVMGMNVEGNWFFSCCMFLCCDGL